MQYQHYDDERENDNGKKKPDNPLKKIVSPKPITKKQTNHIDIKYSDIINILNKLIRKKR